MLHPLSDRARFVEGDFSVAALAAEAAVATDNKLLGGNVIQRHANSIGHVLGAVSLQRAMADGTNADFLGQLALYGAEKLDVLKVAVFCFDGPHVATHLIQIQFERCGVAGVFHDPLHVGVAPAGVNPDFDIIQTLHFAVVAIDHELDLFALGAKGIRHEVQRGLLDLNALAASVAQSEQFLIHGHGHVPDNFVVVLVLGGVDVEKQAHDLRAAGAEANGLASFGLGQPPNLSVIQ